MNLNRLFERLGQIAVDSAALTPSHTRPLAAAVPEFTASEFATGSADEAVVR